MSDQLYQPAYSFTGSVLNRPVLCGPGRSETPLDSVHRPGLKLGSPYALVALTWLLVL